MVVTMLVTVLGLIIPAMTQDIVIPAMTQGTVMPLTMAQALMALAATLTMVQTLITVPANIQNMTKKTPSRATTKSQGRIQKTMIF